MRRRYRRPPVRRYQPRDYRGRYTRGPRSTPVPAWGPVVFVLGFALALVIAANT